MSEVNRNSERDLDSLFASYRQAATVEEASPNFMPKLWERIEARRRYSVALWRWTRGFITAAAAASLALGMMQLVPDRSTVYHTTYLETLAEDGTQEQTLIQDVAAASRPAMPTPPAAGTEALPRR